MSARIYTKTGDRGDTGLVDGSRVPKDDPRIAANGDVDELQATLGLIKSELRNDAPIATLLGDIQRDLFSLSARIGDPKDKVAAKKEKVVLTEERITTLEREIDAREAELPKLRAFILAGGGVTGARLHLARTICRRAERSVVALGRGVELDPALLRYLNRLSDLLFVMARHENQREGKSEDLW